MRSRRATASRPPASARPPQGTRSNGSGTGRTGRPGPGAAAAPAMLPATVPGFTGRAPELRALSGLLRRPDGPVLITAIGGTAGVGKTALAVHWAHQRGGRVPRRAAVCEPARLRPGRPAAPRPRRCARSSTRWACPPRRSPATLDGRQALYRSLLAGTADADRAGQRARPGPGPPAAARRTPAAWSWSPAAASSPAWSPPTAPAARPGRADRGRGPRAAGRAGSAPTGVAAEPERGRRADRAVRPAAAGAGHRRRPRRQPARASRWPRWPPSCATPAAVWTP